MRSCVACERQTWNLVCATTSRKHSNSTRLLLSNLLPKPYRPIPETDHIRLPDWCDRERLVAFVRENTEQGIDLSKEDQWQLCGRGATQMVKGLKRAIAFQQALIRAEGWPKRGLTRCSNGIHSKGNT